MILSHKVPIENIHSGKDNFLNNLLSHTLHFITLHCICFLWYGISNLCSFKFERFSTVPVFHKCLLYIEHQHLKILRILIFIVLEYKILRILSIGHFTQITAPKFPKVPLMVAFISAVSQEWDVLLVYHTGRVRKI